MMLTFRNFFPRATALVEVVEAAFIEPVMPTATPADKASRNMWRLRVMRDIIPVGGGASERSSLRKNEKNLVGGEMYNIG